MTASLATTALTRFLEIGGTRFAYRRFGNVLKIFLSYLTTSSKLPQKNVSALFGQNK